MCVRALDTACWGEGIFARVCRHFFIFTTMKICQPESREPGVGPLPLSGVGGAVGQRPADLSADVVGP